MDRSDVVNKLPTTHFKVEIVLGPVTVITPLSFNPLITIIRKRMFLNILKQARFYSTTLERPLKGKFTETPLVLYRIQSAQKVSLRDYDSQKSKGRTSFDLVLQNGLVIPSKGDNFVRKQSSSFLCNFLNQDPMECHLDLEGLFLEKSSPISVELIESLKFPKV